MPAGQIARARMHANGSMWGVGWQWTCRWEAAGLNGVGTTPVTLLHLAVVAHLRSHLHDLPQLQFSLAWLQEMRMYKRE